MLSLQVFKDSKAPASALLSAVLAKYGTECLEWEPELLRNEIEQDYDIKITDLQSDKLQAAILVLTTDAFEGRWEVFETCCHLFNNIPDNMESFEPLEAEELVSGICEAMIIRHEKIEYQPEVNAYAGVVFFEYGLSKAPDLFPTAIMPKTQASDDKEHNAGLQEIFDSHLNYVTNYLSKIK